MPSIQLPSANVLAFRLEMGRGMCQERPAIDICCRLGWVQSQWNRAVSLGEPGAHSFLILKNFRAAAAQPPSPAPRRSPLAESQPPVAHDNVRPPSASSHLPPRNVPPLTEPRNAYPPGYRIRTLEGRVAEEATRTQASSSATTHQPRQQIQTQPPSNSQYTQPWDPPRPISQYQFSYSSDNWIPQTDFYEQPVRNHASLLRIAYL